MASPFYFESTTYQSEGDEDAHFRWLGSIGCIRGVQGEGRNLFLDIDVEGITDADLRELRAVYRRYGGNLGQLEGLCPPGSPAEAGVQFRRRAGSRPTSGNE